MNSTCLGNVLTRLKGIRKVGSGWSAHCPSHDDRKPSLSIAEGDDGQVLVHCHAGCKTADVVAAIGLSMADLMPVRGSAATNGERRIVDTYDYLDDAGNVLFQVVRFVPKDFRQRRPDGNGGWNWNVKGVRVVPYRLRELLADATGLVFIVEGEKDADSLACFGLVVTCNAGGAGKWLVEHSEFLRGRVVIIIPDNDEAGQNHARQVARSLQGVAESVRIVKLPGLPTKGDVSDWIAAGGTKEELMRLAEATPEWSPPAMETPGPILTCLADVEPRPVSWLWQNRIALGRITLLVGVPGAGKSFLTCDMAARISTGRPWPDGSQCPRGSVIVISAEDDPADTIRPRLDAHGADVRHVHLLSAVRRVDSEGQYVRMVTLADVDAIETALSRLPDCKLVVVDPVGSFLGGKTDAHRDNEVRSVLAPIAALAEKYGVAVLVVAHRRKTESKHADDTALGSRAFTGIARSVHHLSKDPEDKERRLLLPGKNNLAREGEGLAFSIAGDPARIEWEPDPVSMSADEALARENGNQSKMSAVDEAVAWLKTQLAGGPRQAGDLKDAANADGIAPRTLDRAKGVLGVIANPTGFGGPWCWRLPDKPRLRQVPAEIAKPNSLAHTETTGEELDELSSPDGDWGEV